MKSTYSRKLIVGMLLLAGTSAYAQTWSSTTGGNWSVGTNWSTTPTAPANDGTGAILFNANPVTLTSTIDTNYSILSLTFGNSAGPWTIGNSGGAALTIGSGGITNNSAPGGAQLQTISGPITIGASQTWNAGTFNSVNRQVNINGVITGTSDKTITVSSAQAATLYRRFRISGNNTATLASNWIVDAGGRLSLASSATANFGTGTITVNSGGLVGGEGGNSVISNNITLAGGALGALGDGDGGSFSGTINITADSFINMTRGSGGAILNSANTAASIITGSGNLTQTIDSGTTTKITAIGNTSSAFNNTNTGTLIINAGRVQLQKADNTVAWGGNVVINSGGTLQYNAFRENLIGDTATVTINSGGTMSLAHDNSSQLHEKVAALVVNASSGAFSNDTSAAGTARIIVGSGTSGTGTGGIFVNSTGSLSGAGGTVNKAATIQGGTLFAGTDGTVGTLAFSQGLTFATGLAVGSLKFDLGADTTAGTTYDTITVDNLALGSGLLNFNSVAITSLPGFGQGVYTLFSSTNPITGTLGSSLTGTIGGLAATLSLSGNNVILTAVPEPSAYAALAGLGAIGFVAYRRRRQGAE